MDYPHLQQINNTINNLTMNIFQINRQPQLNNTRLFFNPPNSYNLHLKYLFMGLNPSDARRLVDPTLHQHDSDLLLTIKRITQNNLIIPTRITRGIQPLVYGRYFNAPLKLIAFDPNVKMFWEKEEVFELIFQQYPDYRRYLREFRDYITFGNENDEYIMFCDLLYWLEQTQANLTRIIENNVQLKMNLRSFFINQLEYYHPKNLIILNRFVADFVKGIYAPITIQNDNFFDEDHQVQIFFLNYLSRWTRNERILELQTMIRENLHT